MRRRRPGSRRVTWLVAGSLFAAMAAALSWHYRVGRSWLIYLGAEGPGVPLDVHAAGDRALAEPRDDVPGVANFARVSGELYRGAQPTEEGFAELRRLGVRTVVSLRETDSDRSELEGTGLRYVRIPMSPAHPEDEEIVPFLKLFDDPANLPVFVHCQKGADRTGTACAAYRIVRQDWTAEEAVRELPAFGFHEVWEGCLVYLDGLDPEAMRQRVADAESAEVSVVE